MLRKERKKRRRFLFCEAIEPGRIERRVIAGDGVGFIIYIIIYLSYHIPQGTDPLTFPPEAEPPTPAGGEVDGKILYNVAGSRYHRDQILKFHSCE